LEQKNRLLDFCYREGSGRKEAGGGIGIGTKVVRGFLWCHKGLYLMALSECWVQSIIGQAFREKR